MSIEPDVPAVPDLDDRVALLKALADRSRLAVAAALLERPHCAEELAERLKLAPSTVSFHLRKLEEANLVTKTRTQYYLVYELRPALLELRLGDLVAGPRRGEEAERRRLRQARDRVLRAFFRNGELVRIPRGWRKQRMVLEEFLPLFDASRTYAERDVDERIRTKHADHCAIRRMLIDQGLMTREAGLYRLAGPGKEERAMETRAEKIRAYKEAPRDAGVYTITNTANGRTFLGSAKNLHGPLNRHRFLLSLRQHPIRDLQADWDRYGPDAFRFEVAEVVERKDEPGFDPDAELARLERAWIERVKPFGPGGYNVDRDLRKTTFRPASP